MNDKPGTPANPENHGQVHRTTLLYLTVAAIMVGLLLVAGVGAFGFGDDGESSTPELSTGEADDQETAAADAESDGADDAGESAGADDGGEEADETDGPEENDAAGDDEGEDADEADASEENDAPDEGEEDDGEEVDAAEENDDGDDENDETDDETAGDEDEADSNESADGPSDEEIQAAFNESIAEYVNVTALEMRETHEAENQTHLEYETDAENRSELKAEMRDIAVMYAEAVEDGWETDELWADFVAEEHDEYGHFTVDQQWAEDWVNDEMSDEEFFQRVEDTLVTFPLMSEGE